MPTSMYPVNSSQISYIGYDEITKELFITFKNGSIYKYEDVPLFKFNNMKANSSVGKYFNMYIKDIYISTKIK